MSKARTQRTYRSSLQWGQFTRSVAEWQRQMRSRDELYGMSDAELRDIGLTRSDAAHEQSTPFWMA